LVSLNGEHILLRAVEPSDLDILHQWENNAEIWQVSNTYAPFSRNIIKKYIENAQLDIFEAKQLRLMIDLKEKDKQRTIGTIDLFDFEPMHKRAGIGILISENKDRRNGYAREALTIMINYCFEILNLHQLFCNIVKNNKASLKLFRKKGFEIIGLKKQWCLNNGKWVDEYMLQLINPC
jgi:diamine N-acetyltransferase